MVLCFGLNPQADHIVSQIKTLKRIFFVVSFCFVFVCWFLQIPGSFLYEATPCRILYYAAFHTARNREFHGNNQIIMKVGLGAFSLMGIILHEQYLQFLI